MHPRGQGRCPRLRCLRHPFFRAGDVAGGSINSVGAIANFGASASSFAAQTSVLARASPVFSVAGVAAQNAQTIHAAASGDRFDRWVAGTEVTLRTSAYTAGYVMGGPVGAGAAATVYDASSAIGKPIGTWAGNHLSDNDVFKRATDRWFGLKSSEDRLAALDRQFLEIRAARQQAPR